MTDPDTRPAIIKFVERVNRAGLAGHPPRPESTYESPRPATVPVQQRPTGLDGQDQARMSAAAEHALTAYPGPVGELVHREVHAFLEFGHCIGGSGLAARLVDHLLAIDPHPRPSFPIAMHTEAST